MNRSLRVFVIAIAAAIGQSVAPAQAPAQPAAPRPAAPAPAAATRSASPASHAAVIDVGYIFKNHARFKAAIDKMKEEVVAAENQLKTERDRINGLMEKLKAFTAGTPEYRNLEAAIAKAQGDFSVNAQLQKKDFMDRETKVYMQVYMEIERAVSQFARENGITVVHRFDGEAVDNGDRNRILGNITKSIVYYDPQIDITADILKMLNGTAAQPAQTKPLR